MREHADVAKEVEGLVKHAAERVWNASTQLAQANTGPTEAVAVLQEAQNHRRQSVEQLAQVLVAEKRQRAHQVQQLSSRNAELRKRLDQSAAELAELEKAVGVVMHKSYDFNHVVSLLQSRRKSEHGK
mmetsp:Transcript_90445/g.242225  ORF Transcript_90445/g.242225 Transcript_90445/m.242225 type:complete len:128 (-) Transcript_90445:21-404(-)